MAFDQSLGRSDAPIPVADPVANDPSFFAFTEEELEAALQTSRTSSTPGLDALPYTVMKIPLVKSYVLSICNSTNASGIASPLWLNSAIVPLHKKGPFHDPSNYRGIALTSTAAKLFNKMFLYRLRSLIDHKLRSSQNGFRPHRSCTQHIMALRRIVENCRVLQHQSVIITFIDFSKALDNVSRQYLYDTLIELEIPIYLITAIFSLYHGSTSQVMTPHGLTDKIPMNRESCKGTP
jgi:hypothetical protein